MNNKKKKSLIIKRQLANMIESYAAIVSIPDFDIKEYTKAAIRDIFIQMPSRSITYENWPGFKQYVVGFFGEDSYNIAMEELLQEEWITKGETRYEWRKMYGPVGTIPKYKPYLNEWADVITTYQNGVKKKYSYLDKDAYPFGYDVDENVVYLSNARDMHGEKTGDWIIYKKGHSSIRGRVWINDKIISFWKYPVSKTQLNNLIEKLNEKLKEKNLPEISYNWKIDIPITEVDLYNPDRFEMVDDEHSDDETYDTFRDVISFLIPISQWKPEIVENPKEYLNKMNSSYTNKRFKLDKKYFDKIGSGYSLDDVPAFVKHGIERTSDSVIISKPILEWADGLKYKGKEYSYDDSPNIVFGYSNGVLKTGVNKTHYDIGISSNDPDLSKNYAGRIWTKIKVISFWGYPETKEKLMNIIEDLKNETNINIDSSWKLEIPHEILNKKVMVKNKNKIKYDYSNVLVGVYGKSNYIKIDEYNPNDLFKTKESKSALLNKAQLHVMSPLEKAKRGIKIKAPGFGAEKRYSVDKMDKVGRAYKQGDIPQHVAHQLKYTSDSIIKNKSLLENQLKDDYKDYIPKLSKFMIENGMKILPLPKVKIRNNEIKNSESIFGKTAHYDKDNKEITLFTLDRHPKDILRSFAHEMVHHEQNLKGLLNNINTTNTNEDGKLEEFEKEAYEKGNLMLRNWEDSIKSNKSNLNENYIPKIKDKVRVDKKWFADEKEHVGEVIWTSPDKSRIKVKCDTYPHLFTISTKNVEPVKGNLNEIQTEYGCLMLKINFPGWDKFVSNYIKEEDLYDNAAHEYGREYECHVTILYGFHEDVDVEKIKQIVQSIANEIIITTNKINVFSTKNFDVVKFEVKSATLNKLNEIMRRHFKYTSSHNDYKAHMTIGYVKPGLGEKYIKNLNKIITLKSGTFMYSYPGGRKEEFSIKKIDKL